MIPHQVLQGIQDCVRIEEVISDFITLKKRGRNLWACCPFHQEKTPSFSVSPERGFYKCFGCGVAGDAIGFVRRIEGIGFIEAVRHLAQKYGLPFEVENTQSNGALRTHTEKLYDVLEMAKTHYVENLWHHTEGKSIGKALLQSRKIDFEAVRAFHIGYSMRGGQSFYKLAQQQGYTEADLEEVGLLVRKTHACYDLFRGRVMFPIQDASGRVIAFGGRTTAQATGPKYVNSPQTILYNKREVLYGLFQAKDSIKKQGYCLLVEGYTDVVRLHALGITYTVSLSGTSLTDLQIKQLSRITQHIFLVLDGDTAGTQAALRNIDAILSCGLDVSVVALPKGQDPDSCAQRMGKERFEAYIQAHKKNFVECKVGTWIAQNPHPTPTDHAEGVRDILRSVALVPDALKRDFFLKQTSTLLRVEESLLRAEQEGLSVPTEPVRPTTLRTTRRSGTDLDSETAGYERENMRLLLCYGTLQIDDQTPLCAYLLEELKDVTMHTPHYAAMLDVCKERLLRGQSTDGTYFLQHAEDKLKRVAIDLMASPYEISNDWQRRHQIHTATEADRLYQTACKNVLRLKLKLVQKLVADNQHALSQTKQDTDQDRLLRVHTSLKKTEGAIAQALGMVVW